MMLLLIYFSYINMSFVKTNFYPDLHAPQPSAFSNIHPKGQGRRNVFSFGGGGGKDKKGHCNVKKGTNGVHADNYH